MMLSSSFSYIAFLVLVSCCCCKKTRLFVSSFQLSSHHRRRHDVVIAMTKKAASENKDEHQDDVFNQNNLLNDRRSMLTAFGLSTTTAAIMLLLPRASHAGIDVSGLRVDTGGGGGSAGNPDLAAQLKQYDGSAASRISEIKAAATTSSSSSTSGGRSTTTTTTATSTAAAAAAADTTSPYAATYAYRSAPGFNPSLTKLGALGERYRLEDRVEGPLVVLPNGKTRRNSGDLRVSFEFPSDWLQLDRAMGGLQYVDQRNGDKLYLLKVALPPNTTLANVDKRFLGDAIFDAQGSLVKSGVAIDSYRVGKSETFSDGSLSTAHRRFLLKYATVTGNGLVTERRGWADAFQVDENLLFAYMLVTTSNAVKFEAMGRERDTVDAIVNSFQLERI